MQIECANKLGVLLERPKRIKILVGGRASTKSTFVSDVVLSKISSGQRWCCGREYQNSIDDSVHSLLSDEITRCGFNGFDILRSEINHVSGGKALYRGLARNITSLKGLNVDGLWIEEGESLSKMTLKVLTASVRLSAKQVDLGVTEEPEIWVTMNRGSSIDPIAEKFLKRAEPDLKRTGFYEDDMMMVVEINYNENPWFEKSGLESERADDERTMSKDEYEHKWLGEYADSVENNIIKKEWFDAAVDAHVKLNIKPTGAITASHDPADEGGDSKAYACKHGIVVTQATEIVNGNGNEACDTACEMARNDRADLFVWDADGMGALLRRQIGDAFKGTKVQLRAYKGSNSVDDPKSHYEGLGSLSSKDRPKTNADTFKNKRSQFGIKLANRFFNTYRVIVKDEYVDPDELISISSNIELIDKLRSEVCRVPRKLGSGAGKIQLMSKSEMLSKHGIESPGMYDCLTMLMESPDSVGKAKKINFKGWN